MRALKKNKHVKEFVANLEKQSGGDSDPHDYDALDNLIAHILVIFHTIEESNNHSIDLEEGEDHHKVNVFFNNPSDFVVAHTVTHNYPPPIS